jgi:hypothetical protein
MAISSETAVFLLPLAAVMFNVISELILLKTILKASLLKSIVAGFFLGMVALLVMVFAGFVTDWFPGLISVNNLFSLAGFYFCLSYTYFHYMNIGQASLRIRILHELKGKESGLEQAKIFQLYNAQSMIDFRLERLTLSGEILKKNGHYILGKPRLILAAKIFELLKRVIYGKKQYFLKREKYLS